MLTDITEELWTGRGAEVQVGKAFSYFLHSGELNTKNDEFMDMLLETLSEQGYNIIDQIEKAGLRSIEQNRRTGHHELELRLSGVGGNLYRGPRPKRQNFDLIIGAEFTPTDEEGVYELTMFPKVKTASGEVIRTATRQHPELASQLKREFGLTYSLLQKMNYIV